MFDLSPLRGMPKPFSPYAVLKISLENYSLYPNLESKFYEFLFFSCPT